MMTVLAKYMLTPLFSFLVFTGVFSCGENEGEEEQETNQVELKNLTVTATAYNSLPLQGEGNAKITAWGDTLHPGIKSIAVSRDLIAKGLTYGTPVQIEGFEGIFIVNDKMHPRWRNKIDIYMGLDREKALQWGRRKVEIHFPDPQ